MLPLYTNDSQQWLQWLQWMLSRYMGWTVSGIYMYKRDLNPLLPASCPIERLYVLSWAVCTIAPANPPASRTTAVRPQIPGICALLPELSVRFSLLRHLLLAALQMLPSTSLSSSPPKSRCSSAPCPPGTSSAPSRPPAGAYPTAAEGMSLKSLHQRRCPVDSLSG
jgi:hypothetical protein